MKSGGVVVSSLDLEVVLKIPTPLASLNEHGYDKYTDRMDCHWEDMMARERPDHLPLYAQAEKLNLLTFHVLGSLLIVNLRDCYFLLLRFQYRAINKPTGCKTLISAISFLAQK